MLFAIGDIHGHFAKLMAVMAHCRDYASGRGDEARFVLLGDYIDRGPCSRQVLDFLAAKPSGVTAILGNHEDMMLRALADRGMEAVWHRNGGLQTLASYGAATIDEVPAAHVDLLRALPLYVDDGLRLFVHAGLDPEEPDGRDPAVLLWTRDHPADDARLPRFVVHGHTPTRDHRPDLRPNRLNLDTGAGFGHAVTAAGFGSKAAAPVVFIDNLGEITASSAKC